MSSGLMRKNEMQTNCLIYQKSKSQSLSLVHDQNIIVSFQWTNSSMKLPDDMQLKFKCCYSMHKRRRRFHIQLKHLTVYSCVQFFNRILFDIWIMLITSARSIWHMNANWISERLKEKLSRNLLMTNGNKLRKSQLISDNCFLWWKIWHDSH